MRHEMKIRDRIRELRRVKASDLIPSRKNSRLHLNGQRKALKGILAELGFAGAVLVRELPDGRLQLCDGHLRSEVLGEQEIPVLVTDLTEEEADKLMLVYDPLAAMAEVDEQKLEELLASVQFQNKDIGPLLERLAGEEGWAAIAEPEQLADPEAQIDKAAELAARWSTAPGQTWQIGPHRLVCGDCREKAVVGRLWRDGGPKIRMVWTDPPYGVDYAAKNAALNATDRGARVQKPIENDALPPEETGQVFTAALSACIPFTEKGANIYATVPAGPLFPIFVAAMNASGFTCRWSLVWVKNHFVIGRSDYHFRHEPILYGWIENGPHYFTEDRTQDSVFEVDKPHVSDTHPTQKPVELISRMIANSSRPGELVFDPFCGSGSTLLAAHQLNRIGYGVEVDPGYVAVALDRLASLGLEPMLQTRGRRTRR